MPSITSELEITSANKFNTAKDDSLSVQCLKPNTWAYPLVPVRSIVEPRPAFGITTQPVQNADASIFCNRALKTARFASLVSPFKMSNDADYERNLKYRFGDITP